MADLLKIKQLKYIAEPKEGAEGLRQQVLTDGSLFGNYNIEYVTQIGIQTLPGVRFTLNNSYEYITVGQTGIYEIELSDGPTITSLQFDSESIDLINSMQDAYLIIDMIYKASEVNN